MKRDFKVYGSIGHRRLNSRPAETCYWPSDFTVDCLFCGMDVGSGNKTHHLHVLVTGFRLPINWIPAGCCLSWREPEMHCRSLPSLASRSFTSFVKVTTERVCGGGEG